MITLNENTRIHHATKAKADRLASAFAADYPALDLRPMVDDNDVLTGWIVVHTAMESEEADETVVFDGPKVPHLQDVLEACDQAGVDPEEGFEEGPSGSVVPEEYRAMYKEASSNGQTCGDWLAEFLTGQCHGVDGFNVDDFQTILDNNEVDQSGAWARLPESGQKGWIGRWRMNGRQTLEKVVAEVGFVRGVTGERFDLPEGDLAALQRKHAKYLAKREKAKAKEAEAA